MAKYMRDQFAFLGIPSVPRRSLQREAFSRMGPPSGDALLRLAEELWALAEREYQYAACDLLAKHVALLGPEHLGRVRQLIETRSWWDTVDTLAAHVVGPMVAVTPALVSDMDRWVTDGNLWVARTALLHQLRYRERTDAVRLFRYCELQSGHRDFFIRKAIGWALREYSKTDPRAVQAFIASHEESLSPLSRREALLWLAGRGRTFQQSS